MTKGNTNISINSVEQSTDTMIAKYIPRARRKAVSRRMLAAKRAKRLRLGVDAETLRWRAMDDAKRASGAVSYCVCCGAKFIEGTGWVEKHQSPCANGRYGWTFTITERPLFKKEWPISYS